MAFCCELKCYRFYKDRSLSCESNCSIWDSVLIVLAMEKERTDSKKSKKSTTSQERDPELGSPPEALTAETMALLTSNQDGRQPEHHEENPSPEHIQLSEHQVPASGQRLGQEDRDWIVEQILASERRILDRFDDRFSVQEIFGRKVGCSYLSRRTKMENYLF